MTYKKHEYKILFYLLIFMSTENFASKIILLNGTSSAGKTTIAKNLQELLGDSVLFHTGVDHFWKMVPREFYDGFGTKSHETWLFSPSVDDQNNAVVHVTVGPLGKKFGYTMAQFIKCLADCGHDVVVDEVLLHDESFHYYAQALKDHTVYFVGVMCDMHELERREVQRGDRLVGIARGLREVVHKYKEYYDIIVDTTHISGVEGAQHILDGMQVMPHPRGLQRFKIDNEAK